MVCCAGPQTEGKCCLGGETETESCHSAHGCCFRIEQQPCGGHQELTAATPIPPAGHREAPKKYHEPSRGPSPAGAGNAPHKVIPAGVWGVRAAAHRMWGTYHRARGVPDRHMLQTGGAVQLGVKIRTG